MNLRTRSPLPCTKRLTLLATLEDARDALIDSGHLAGVLAVEAEIRTLSRKLRFDDPEGGAGGR